MRRSFHGSSPLGGGVKAMAPARRVYAASLPARFGPCENRKMSGPWTGLKARVPFAPRFGFGIRLDDASEVTPVKTLLDRTGTARIKSGPIEGEHAASHQGFLQC
jgi:hypothetical protein